MRVRNPSKTEAVDLSGWRLQGAGTATLPPGTVIPAGGDLVVPTDVVASAGDRFPGTLVAGALIAWRYLPARAPESGEIDGREAVPATVRSGVPGPPLQ